MSASTFYRFLSLGVGAFLFFLLDLATKLYFFGHQEPILGMFVRFERHENHGLSFNLPVPVFVPLLVAVIAITAALVYANRQRQTLNATKIVALALFIGGTLGNAYDRYSLGYVRDWMAIYRSIFNLADIFILVGLVILITITSQQPSALPTPGR